MLNNRHVLSLAGNGIMAVFSLVANMMLFRMLSKSAMGSWLMYQLIFIFIDSFRTGFLQTAVIKFYSGADETRRREIAGATWHIGLMITIIFIGINLVSFLGLGLFDDVSIILALKWFGITLIVTLPYNIAFWILQAEQQFDRILYMRLINQGCFIIGIIALYVSSVLDLQTVIIAFVTSAAITSTVALVLGWSHLSAYRSKTKQAVQELFHFGKFSVGSFISTTLLRSSDSFIIRFFLGPAAVAIYNLPARLLEVIEILIRSLAATGMSSMSAAANQNNVAEVSKIIKKYSALITVVLIPVVAVCVVMAPYLVLILGGNKYTDGASVNVFRILVCIALLFPLDRFLGMGLDTIHKPQLNFVKVIIMLVVNICGDIAGIHIFGNVFGVAISTIFSLFAGMLFSYIMLRKHIEFDLKGFLKIGYNEVKSLAGGLSRKFVNR